ncbi:unnamed protein product [Didymodactylos carnosus]|uniref:Uncharacterized protein n=1 Tax=Didymodactylos carnosus TaxID=1234261 RepID=A0A815G827_9BILA|nr:unnamed protein product [Didymodactylos carnosus]CAF1335053.1 unnamed protein product [Didymodactylos carnosus]CAF3896885.1 unnamed protein product [Didymodactylos carnosus]CAF4191534.1 unnamed protein product [Didymodactylos carnosus]
MASDSTDEKFESLMKHYMEYFFARERFRVRITQKQEQDVIETYKKMLDLGIKGATDPGPSLQWFKEFFAENWEWFQSEGIGLMNDDLFPREEVAKLYSKLEDIGKGPKPGLADKDEKFITQLNYCKIHSLRMRIPGEIISITKKQNQEAMVSWKTLLDYVLKNTERKAELSTAEEETLRSDFERWLFYNHKFIKVQIGIIRKNEIGSDEDRNELQNYLEKVAEKLKKWAPLTYRIFGLPCGIDGGPLGNEKIDLTLMTEDVDLITQFFEDRKYKHQAIPGLTRTHLKNKALQPNNKNFPASTLFNNMDEVRELLASRYISLSTDKSLFHDYRCSSLLTDRTGVFTGNGVVFIYITGHGMSPELANELMKGLIPLDKKHPQYKGYLVAQPGHGCLRPDELLEGGQIVAFTKFIGVQDFILEFLETCRTNQVEESISPDFESEPEIFQQRHLVIVADACFSGNWIKNNLAEQFKAAYIKGTDISITIQTSTNGQLPSYGYFFTPLFVELQTLDEKTLADLANEFTRLSKESKSPFSTQLQERLRVEELPTPQFCYYETVCNSQKNDQMNYLLPNPRAYENKLYFTVHNLNFFVDSNFFAFLSLRHMNNSLGPDISSLKLRPLLNRDEGQQFLERLTRAKTIKIRGMKLKKFKDNTPMCIAAVRSPDNKFQGKHILTEIGEYWYHLHVHFDGVSNNRTPFPGKITHIKLVYADEGALQYIQRGQYDEQDIFSDASEDNQDDYEAMGGKLAAVRFVKRNAEFFVGNWKKYRNELKTCLVEWGQMQPINTFLSKGQVQNGIEVEERDKILFRNIWSDKSLWEKLQPVQFGAVLVRQRSRCLTTSQELVGQIVDRIRTEFLDDRYLEYKPKEEKKKQEERPAIEYMDA